MHVCVHVGEVYSHMHVWRLGINMEYHPLSVFTLNFETSLSLNLGSWIDWSSWSESPWDLLPFPLQS